MNTITDERYGKARFSLGKVEGWVEKASEDYKLVPDETLKHLGIIEDALRYFAKSAAKFMHAAQTKEEEVKARSLAQRTEDSRVVVSLDPQFDQSDPSNFGNYYIHSLKADGAEHNPARAFRNNEGVCMEMNPLPIPYTFTLAELRGIVRLLEDRGKDLPWNDANEGYNK